MCLGTIGTVTRVWEAGGMPMAELATGRGELVVNLSYHPDAAVGSSVLAHMGFVLEVLDDDTAADARAAREELGEAAGYEA